MSEKVNHVRPILKYTMLPGLLPRINELFASGFSYFAFLMASIYNIFHLIPTGHPYLNASNIGRFGVRHVIAEASRNLVFKKQNIDQIILYFVLLAAIVLLAVQFLFLGLALISPAAMAEPFSAYFGVNHPGAEGATQDIAFILMDRVFGVEGLFESCVTTATPCYGLTEQLTFDLDNVTAVPEAPWPFHFALHNMFRFYSTGLLIIGMIVILYHIVAITIETAQTGTPFGKRFNSVWAPIRLVVAIGLLVPLASGLNSAQFIVLYAAKLGSNLATNAWIEFNVTLSGAVAGGALINAEEMIATPNAPNPTDLLTFMVLAKACAMAEDSQFQNQGNAAAPGGTFRSGDEPGLNQHQRNAIRPWLVKAIGAPSQVPFSESHASGTAAAAPDINYEDARDFYENGDILVRFGEYNPNRYQAEKGGVYPYCGELVLKNSALFEPGALEVQESYYDLIAQMWADARINRIAHYHMELNVNNLPFLLGSDAPVQPSTWPEIAPAVPVAPNDIPSLNAAYVTSINNGIAEAIEEQQDNAETDFPEQLLARGWGGAGIWYNRIAQMNGAIVGASRNLPSIKAYPSTMRYTIEQHNIMDENVSKMLDQLDPAVKEKLLNYPRTGEASTQKGYHAIFKAMGKSPSELEPIQTGNPIVDAINLMFGTEGLMNLRSPENRDVHPLAQLAGVGKSLIESAIMMLGVGVIGGGACVGGEDSGCTAMSAAFSIVGLGLTVGFILFYIIPFLPFVYFFFAVGNWVKSVFEAMVGAPLWALGHLRIDGDGLPGEGAMNGYYLIFEIFLRPILIVFGFLASILIFAAMASVLNDIWNIVTVNASGFNSADPSASGGGAVAEAISWSRGKVDQIFFLVIYAVIMYMMALSSFKLIDMIPNSILRWMGSSVTSFGDQTQDAAQSLTQYAAIGGGMVFQQGLGGVQGGISGVRQGQQASAQAEQQQGLMARIEALEKG